MIRYALSAAVLIAITAPSAQATLVAGDIAIVGFQSDGVDAFSFVALTDLPGSTSINFTDNGWITTGVDSDSFRANEGIDTFTTPSGGLAAGTVTTISVSSMNLSASGDQILAYLGAASSPDFLYAVDFDSAAFSDATSSNTTGLPTGLSTGASTAIDFGELDNGVYTGTRTGTPADLLAAIADQDNWAGSNSPLGGTDPGAFTVLAAIPEPSSALIGGLLASVLGTTVARRR